MIARWLKHLHEIFPFVWGCYVGVISQKTFYNLFKPPDCTRISNSQKTYIGNKRTIKKSTINTDSD